MQPYLINPTRQQESIKGHGHQPMNYFNKNIAYV
jgi:hypothetical protein